MSGRRAQLLPLSGATPEAVPDLARAYADAVLDPARSLADICFSAGVGRTHHPWRLALVGRSREELAARLRSATAPARRAAGPPAVAFVFSGTGQERALMGRRLLAEEPVFVRMLERCEAALAAHVRWSLVEELAAGERRSRLHVPEVGQPALWALQVSLAALWRSWGLEPAAVAGHSMGEVSACTVAGALSLTDAARVMVERARLVTRLSGRGATAAVAADAGALGAALDAGGGLVAVAADNGPGQTVLSGESAALARVLDALAREGVSTRPLDLPYAVHSAQLREHAEAHAEALAQVEPRAPEVPVASTLTGSLETGPVFDGGYWARNVSQPVRFGPAIRRLAGEGVGAFLEVGAQPTLGASINRTLNACGASGTVLASLARDRDDREALLSSLGALYVAGADVRWAGLHGRGARRVQLPRYRWQRERHRLDRAGAASRRGGRVPLHELAWLPVQGEPGAVPAGADVVVAAPLGADPAPLVEAARAAGCRCRVATGAETAPLDGATHVVLLAHGGVDASHPADLEERGALAFLTLVQRLLRAGGSRPPRLVTVTRAATGGEEAPQGAAVLGMARTLPLEHPELPCRRIDLRGDLSAAAVLAAALAEDGHDEIVLRTDAAAPLSVERLRPELRPLRMRRPEGRLPVRSDRTYLVTGGLGAIGLLVARRLGERGAGRVVLAARSEAGSAALRAIEAMRRAGATVDVRSADVADRAACSALLDDLRASGPPLGGIVHAAGVLDDGALMSLDHARVEAVLAPKVRGAWYLDELSAGDPIELFVLMSSLAAVTGAPAQAHYAGANAALDALARHRRARGLPALAIQWGPWGGTGMAAHAADRFRAIGLEPLEPAAALDALDRAPAAGRPDLVAAHADWAKLRAALPRPGDGACPVPKSGAPDSEALVDDLRQRLAAILGADPGRIDPDDAINRLGLDSLMAIELRTGIERALPVTLPLTRLLDGMTVNDLASHLADQLAGTALAPSPAANHGELVPAPGELHEPFPLNEIQVAYWMGRRGLFPLGSVSAHIYAEIDVAGLDEARFTQALRTAIDRHPALRTIVHDDGTQQVLAGVPAYRPAVRDLRGDADPEASLTALRERLSHQVLPANRWPLFEFAFTRIDERTTRVHVSLDMLIADAASALMLGDELVALYEGGEPRPPLALSFRDYALALDRARGAPEHEAARAYWAERLKELPPAPELPLAKAPEEIAAARFKRRAHDVDAATWLRLRERAAAAGLTPSALLCAAYAEVLATWSASPRLTINLTTYQRLPLHPDVGELIGDFTALTLLGVEPDAEQPFEERARALSRQLIADLEHRHVNGVTLLRDLVRTRGMPHAAMPVVFTSTLTQTSGRGPLPLDRLGELAHIVTQTPQVWIDCQAVEHDGALTLSWDVVDELFPPGLIDDMFAAYRDLVERLARDEETWRATDLCLLPPAQLARREAANATGADVPPALLHEALWRHAAVSPDAPAVIAPGRTLTYAELAELADRWAAWLVRGGVRRGELVAVAIDRGWEQVVAVMAILRAGAAYLPVDPSLPDERRRQLLATGGVTRVLTQAAVAAGPGAVDPLAAPPAVSPDDVAYVIFTSGSTGTPKGVTIQHAAATNTILDCNRRWGVTAADRTFALSSLGFDLSVYDVFGAIAAGGAVVIPEAERARDPAHWAELMDAHGVTIWNSVPALMTLLTEHLDARGERTCAELRTVLLSGDWIPLGLPGAIRRVAASEPALIGLGGATEASIWSIFHEIGEVRPEWKSIPYGKPLANQRFHVLDERLNPRPTWVRGDLYIAGAGLALGYWGDPEATAAAFVEHPRTGERLYRTGDTGRYLPDGSIEFMGRLDDQVKVGGHRIELGEVEAHLARHPGVARAVVAAPGPREERRLAAFVVPAGAPPDPADLRAWLQGRLPAYMVPPSYTAIDTVPLNANGKVDREALCARAARPHTAEVLDERARAAAGAVADCVTEVAGLDTAGPADDLVELGLDSLRLLRLVERLEARFGTRLEIGDLLRLGTVGAIAEHCAEARPRTKLALPPTPTADSALDPEIAPDPTARPPHGPPERVLLTGATGFLGAHLLDELVHRTHAEVHCLVRAPDAERAAERLTRALGRWGLDDAARSGRWVALPGDVAAPELGVGAERFRRLAASVDAIHHCAGLVNFAYPYERLRRANVLGTREVLRLAARGGGIPVNHVSTTGVVPHLTLGVAQLVPETYDLPPAHTLETGYTASKWAAERLVSAARERGLPVRIFRPGLIAGHSESGVCNPQDALWTVLRGALETGAMPDVDIPLFAAPVDYVAAAIARLGRPAAAPGDVVHLVAPLPLGSRTVFEWLRTGGYALAPVPYPRWREGLAEQARARADSALALLARLLPPELPVTRRLRIETRNAVPAIEDPEIPSPVIEAEHVRRYAEHLAGLGLWPEPNALLV